MYRCDRCDSVFSEPGSKEVQENMDGENGWWKYTRLFCPCCGAYDPVEIADEDEPED